MNIHLLTPDLIVEDYLNIIEANNATVVNKIDKNLPTRPASNTVDQVISTARQENMVLSIVEDSISDHNIIVLQLETVSHRAKTSKTFKHLNHRKLIKSLESNIITAEETSDPNKMYNNFIKNLQNRIEQHTETKRINANNKKWINNEYLQLLKKSKTLHMEAKEIQTEGKSERNTKKRETEQQV